MDATVPYAPDIGQLRRHTLAELNPFFLRSRLILRRFTGTKMCGFENDSKCAHAPNEALILLCFDRESSSCQSFRGKKNIYLRNGSRCTPVEAFLVAIKNTYRARARRPTGINISSSSRRQLLAKKYFRLTHGSSGVPILIFHFSLTPLVSRVNTR